MNRIADARQAWVVTVLLSLFMMVNFANKAVFGLSAVPIMHELHLSHSVFGLLGSAFFMLFSPSAILVGFVANRLSSSCLLFAMALLWSACQLPVVWSASVSSLLLSRIVLGFAEGPAYPVALHAVLKCFAKARQALPVSIIANGASVGTGLIAPTIVLVIERWSWHVAFGFVGIVGLVWCAAWILFGREGAPTGATQSPLRTQDCRIGNSSCAAQSSAPLLCSFPLIGW